MARCLALANALQRRRYQMTFIGKIEGSGWPDRIRRFRHCVSRTPSEAGSVDDRKSFLHEIRTRTPLVVVTDSPHIDSDYLGEIGELVPVVIAMNDSATGRFASDLVINPMLGHPLSDFELGPRTQLLGGNRYAMIRAEFRRARNVRATEPSGPQRVMVALGGGDTSQYSVPIVKSLLQRKRIEKVDLILGVEPSNKKAMEALQADSGGRLTIIADARDLGIRMTKSHLLITGGGNLALEAACVGMPTLMVIRSDAHEMNAVQLDEIGAAQYLGKLATTSSNSVADAAEAILDDSFERKAMSRSGRLLIDGRGGDRIVTATEILLRRSARRRPIVLSAA
jgi:spore coat polysaccharide biosynthesis predicted glycosyltransferase SpsG